MTAFTITTIVVSRAASAVGRAEAHATDHAAEIDLSQTAPLSQ